MERRGCSQINLEAMNAYPRPDQGQGQGPGKAPVKELKANCGMLSGE
jgi:hypothetical protein